MCFTVVNRDHVAVHCLLEHECFATRADVLFNERVRRVHRHITQALRLGVIGHLQAQGVICVQHRGIRRDLHGHTFDGGELLDGLDAAQAEMIGGDVEAGRHVTTRESQPAPEHSTARRFHNGRVNGRIAQDHVCGFRAGHVAGNAELAVDIYAVGRGQSDRHAGQLQDVGEHARRRRFAVGTGNRRDRHTYGQARREQHVDDSGRNVRDAFRPRRGLQARGPVWLVDDVVTTGATIAAAARALRRAGAGPVVGVCVARTPKTALKRSTEGESG